MRTQEAENPLLDSEFFWYSILEGDQIIIEVDYFVDHELVLRRGRPYQVLSKIETNWPVMSDSTIKAILQLSVSILERT